MYREHQYFFYIMSNYERTTVYCGVCNNLTRRVIEHKHGFGSAFTAQYHLTDLVYYEQYQYVRDAIAREKEVKKWRRQKKDFLIKTENSDLVDLSIELLKDIPHQELQGIISELKMRYKK